MLKYFSIVIVLVVLFGCQNVGSPNQEVPDAQPDPEEVITDTVPFTDVPPDIAPDASEVVILQRSAMSNESQMSTSAAIESNDIIGEVGKVFVRQGRSNQWHKITFLNKFRNPVVIMQPLSYNSGDPAVIRIKNVTSQDFEFQVDEWDYLDGVHGKEVVTYLVMESGLWTNGLVYEVGKVRADHNFKKVTLNYPFPSGAVILTQVQSRNDSAAVTTRQQVATGGFRVKVQEEEKADGTHPVEDIGYIVILPGEGPFGKFQALSAKTGNIVSHNFRTINYSFMIDTFGDSYFLAGIQTYAGTDTASLRYRKLTDSSVQVRVEEEQSADAETSHPNESIGYLLLRQADFDEDKIIAFDGEFGDNFGHSVAIDGDTMVVGARLDDDKGTNAGAVYIYERDAKGKWVRVQKIVAFDGKDFDLFGSSVAISGDTVVVGAVQDDDNGNNSGSVHIFGRNKDGINKWGKIKEIIPSDGTAEDRFGRSVGISGDAVVVGASDDDNGNNSGAAYVFERNKDGNDNWGEVGKLLASDGAAEDSFGFSVAISGNIVLVGSKGDDDNGSGSGAAYIFERNNGGTNKWEEVKKILALDGVAKDSFGESVAISGNTLVVGAYGDDNNGTSMGAAYIFERNNGGSNEWGQVKRVVASDGLDYDDFGKSVAISGDIVLVGNRPSESDEANTESVYVYQRNKGGTNQWGQVKRLLPSDEGTGYDKRFGNSVAVSGNTVVVGAYNDDDKVFNSGSAYVFE